MTASPPEVPLSAPPDGAATEPQSPAPLAVVSRAFRALRHRNFRLFFAGQLVSLVGSWMQMLAQGWLVWRLSHSEWVLGALGFAQMGPVLFLGLFGGLAADRFDRHRLVVATQALLALQAVALAAVTLTGVVQVWMVLALGAFLGCVNAFDMSSRQALLLDMAGREDLGNAIALNSSLFNGARIAGPALAGWVVARWGEGACFAANAASYLAVLVGLLAMRFEVRPGPRVQGGAWVRELREGFAFAWGTPAVRDVLGLVVATSLLSAPYTIFLPAFAGDVFQSGSRGLGILMSCVGLGALAGALTVGYRKGTKGLGRLAGLSALGFGATVTAFSLSRSFWLSGALLMGTGFFLMTEVACANTLLQTLAPAALRGRIISFYVVAFIGVTPLGSLAIGRIAAWAGAPQTLAVAGLLTVAAAGVFLVRVPGVRAAMAQAGPGPEAPGALPD